MDVVGGCGGVVFIVKCTVHSMLASSSSSPAVAMCLSPTLTETLFLCILRQIKLFKLVGI